jgi:ParB-like chromosome segregation protein Spo0J
MYEIDTEFQSLIPPLSDEDFEELEADILENGVAVPIEVWGETIIDGHNRYEIATKHGLNYEVRQLHFKSRDEAIDYIYRIQLRRRNLLSQQRIELAERWRQTIAARALERQLVGKADLPPDLGEGSEDPHERETDAQVAKMAGVGRETVRKYRKIHNEGTDELRDAVAAGKRSIDAAYKETRAADEPVLSAEEEALKERLEAGETVVIDMHKGAHDNLMKWAEKRGLFVRIDRKSDWGNPYILDEDADDGIGDGDRDFALESYEHYYLPRKLSLHGRYGELLGKGLGCWCAPKRCHGDILKELAERHSKEAA